MFYENEDDAVVHVSCPCGWCGFVGFLQSSHIILPTWLYYHPIKITRSLTQKFVIAGKRPFVDPRYAERSYAEKKMVEIMEKCWEYNPTKRIDIFEVVRLLREAIAENAKLK